MLPRLGARQTISLVSLTSRGPNQFQCPPHLLANMQLEETLSFGSRGVWHYSLPSSAELKITRSCSSISLYALSIIQYTHNAPCRTQNNMAYTTPICQLWHITHFHTTIICVMAPYNLAQGCRFQLHGIGVNNLPHYTVSQTERRQYKFPQL
jgi:hypothetical protein